MVGGDCIEFTADIVGAARNYPRLIEPQVRWIENGAMRDPGQDPGETSFASTLQLPSKL